MLARHIILNYPDFYPIFKQPDFTWNKIHQYNRNPLLKEMDSADGLKTGYTKEAGYGLVGSAVQNGLRLIVVVNGEKTAKERAGRRQEALGMGLQQFRGAHDVRRQSAARLRQGLWRRLGYVPLKADGAVRVMVPKDGGARLVARIVYSGPVRAPVKRGCRSAS